MPEEPIRFADILTTASAVANYLGEPDVTAANMLHAIAIQCGEETIEALGRPVSPLVPRPPRAAATGADPAVRALTQRWFATLGSDINAVLSGEQVEALRGELRGIGEEG